MAAVMNGLLLHGGMFAACGTFFVFSDYMKPAIRMAALMELPVKYVFTHDAFRVGEDGPTHEPVEHEHQLRLLEELHNQSGKPSLLVLRPADSAETTVAWEMAMANGDTPTALILSRQDVADLPSKGGDRYRDAQGVRRGGYVVKGSGNPDVTLVGNGSEVSLLCDVAVLLDEAGISARVVSVPSIGLFLEQDEAYRRSVIPAGVPVFGLTAGLLLRCGLSWEPMVRYTASDVSEHLRPTRCLMRNSASPRTIYWPRLRNFWHKKSSKLFIE